MNTERPSRQDAENIYVRDGFGGPDLVYDYGTHGNSLPLTEHDLIRTMNMLAARFTVTPVMAAHLERHSLTETEIRRHLDNTRTEIRRHGEALAHIEHVFRLRLNQDTETPS